MGQGELPGDTRPGDVIESIVGSLNHRVLMTQEPVGPDEVEALVDRSLAWFGVV